jgi:hypothetical protein
MTLSIQSLLLCSIVYSRKRTLFYQIFQSCHCFQNVMSQNFHKGRAQMCYINTVASDLTHAIPLRLGQTGNEKI